MLSSILKRCADAIVMSRTGRVVTLVVVGSGVLLYSTRQFSNSEVGKYWFSWLASKVSTNLDPGFRCDFVHLYKQLEMTQYPSHSHPEAATERNEALRSIQAFVHQLGLEPYSVSASAREKDAGYHSWYIAKDLAQPPRWHKVTRNHVIVMCDSDYYADVKAWARYERPMVFYTMVPRSLNGNVADGSYTIMMDNQMHTLLGGGGRYAHQIWDYDTDTLIFDYWGYSIVYSVEFRDLPHCRRLVFLTPLVRVAAPLGWLISGQRLVRKQYAGKFALQSTYMTKDGPMVSLGIQNLGCVDLLASELAAIAIRFMNSKKPQIWDVETFLKKTTGRENTHVDSAILFQILKTMSFESITAIRTMSNAPEYEKEVQRPSNFLAIADNMHITREKGRITMPPVVMHPDLTPCVAEANDMACIQGRINAVLNDAIPPNRYVSYAQEFVKKLVPVPGVGVPWDMEMVIDHLRTAKQVANATRSENWMSLDPSFTIKAFVKAETYANISDPRNISTFPVSHNIEMARYLYPFKYQVLKKTDWYAPGMTTEQIASRIVRLAQTYDTIVESDYSRFDGTISVWLRHHIERAIYCRYFNGEDRRAIGILFDKEIKAKGVTSSGLAYDPHGSRGSGSLTTTDCNTEINAFVDYCAFREGGCSTDEAWARLGLFCGDDGGSGVLANLLERAARDLGLRVKAISRVSSNGDPITFLSRIYPRAWAGDKGSFADPLRALRKIHISFAPDDVSIEQALVNKAFGYLTLDPQVDGVLTRLCHNILAQHPTLTGNITAEDSPYYLWSNQGLEFKTWPQSTGELADKYLVEQLGGDRSCCDGFISEVENGLTVFQYQIINPPPEAKIPAVVTQSAWASLPDWAKRVVRWTPDPKRPVTIPPPPSTVKTTVGEKSAVPAKVNGRFRGPSKSTSQSSVFGYTTKRRPTRKTPRGAN